MTSEKYKNIRASLKKEALQIKKRTKYNLMKKSLLSYAHDFELTDNLSSLVELIVISNRILRGEKFPVEKYEKFKTKK